MKANISSDTFWEVRTHKHFTKADLALWAGKMFSQASQGPRTEPLLSWRPWGLLKPRCPPWPRETS